MTIDEAIEMLRKEYERAKKLDYILKPLVYALYQTWAKAAEDSRHNTFWTAQFMEEPIEREGTMFRPDE